jgi:hypothetical protein
VQYRAQGRVPLEQQGTGIMRAAGMMIVRWE